MKNKYDHLTIEEMQELREQMNADIAQRHRENGMIVAGLITMLTQSNERLEKILKEENEL